MYIQCVKTENKQGLISTVSRTSNGRAALTAVTNRGGSSNSMTIQEPCPICDTEIDVDENDNIVMCECCGAQSDVDWTDDICRLLVIA